MSNDYIQGMLSIVLIVAIFLLGLILGITGTYRVISDDCNKLHQYRNNTIVYKCDILINE